MATKPIVTFEIDRAGDVELSERTPAPEGKSYDWDIINLLDADTERMSLYLSMGDGDDFNDACSLKLSAHHLVNEESGRGFHAYMRVSLSEADMRRLRDYLTFALGETI